MSRSLQIGVPETNPDGHFKVDASVRDVRASGSNSNQVNVNGKLTAPVDAATAATIASQPVGDTINTTHGEAKVHRTVDGKTLVTLPGKGVQVTLEEAKRAGLILPDQSKAAPQETKPTEKPADKSDNADEGEAPTVTAEELSAHAAELNAVGETLDAAGINSEEALTRSVASMMESDTLPADVEQALVTRYGADAGDLVHNAEAHLVARVSDAITAAGLSVKDVEAMKGLQSALENHPDLPKAYVGALRGQPQQLNALVAGYARSRGRR